LATSQRSPDDLSVTVLSIGLDADDERRLRRSTEPLCLRFVPIEHAIPPGLPQLRHLSDATYGRLLGIAQLPDDVGRAVYLDSDLLVLDDLEPLFSMDLEGAAVGAVQSSAIPHIANPLGLNNWRALEIPPTTPYMNAGVLAIDTEEWRAHDLSDAIVDYLTAHRDVLSLADQDGFNAVLRGRFARLPLRWNVEAQLREANHLGYSFFSEEEVDEAIANPAIVHFTGPIKPWHRSCADPRRDEWFEVLGETGFRGFRAKEPINRLRAIYAMKKVLRV
jgi:lipopolysaccharide biosynthesis glycosyltransferase